MAKQTNEINLFSTKQACHYLGMDIALFRYHVYEKGHIKPDLKLANALGFKKETLDEFKRKHQNTEGYSLHQAARYLGVELSWLRHHLFNTHLLLPDGKRGRKFIFAKETLDGMKIFLPKKEEPQREPTE